MSKHGFFKQHFGRRKGSTNLPAEYIQEQTEDEDLNSAVALPPLKYVARINSFATSETNEELESEEDSLFSGAREELQLLEEAIFQYQQKTDPDASSVVEISDTANPWKDVREAVKSAKDREDGQDNDSWSARDSCDKIVDNISTFETWLDLLPGGDYGAVVSGVFKMVVTAAKRANDVRVTIFQALADIPYWVGRANRYRDLYRESKPRELVQMTAQLCSAVLVALRHIMIYFTEGVLKKAWKAMAQGQAYKQTLLSQIERVRDLIAKVDQEAAVSLQYRMRDLEKLSQEYFPAITKQLKELKEQHNSKNFCLDEATKEDLSTRIGEAAAGYVVNSFYSHFSSNPGIDSKTRVPSRILEAQPSAELRKPRESTVTQISLLSALGLSPDIPQQDLKRCLSMGLSLSLTDQDRVEWMIQSPKLRTWLNFPKSRTLLLNGDGDANEMFSSTTFLSAKLLESLGNMEPIVSQHFFCSLHTTSRKDVMADATGLIKSFVSQLLPRGISWDLNYLSTTDLGKIQQNDLATICALFRRLIQQLPDTTFIFWMIDGINYYERSERRRDFLTVVHELLGIIKDYDGVVIKLLLTCPGISLYAKDALGKEDILTVPPTVDGGRQGWSERAFQKTLGKEIKNLEGADLGDSKTASRQSTA
ncbi:MAG: hypothetical protein ASARMPREDX12_002758 [Alectoria sarmentosa]|nr:MAG: hypothetical protein ASARMPREDX12_002758 [Alectoria sarmentosa]